MKYNVWRSNADCSPIAGTDKIYVGPNKRWVMRHVAYENGVEIKPGDWLGIVRLPNGEMFSAIKLSD